MHHPGILFLDEPTLGLDPQARENIWQYIEKLAKDEQMSLVITTHYMEEVDRLCKRLAIIDAGKIVALDSPVNLKRIIGGDIITLRINNPDIEVFKTLDFIKKIEVKNNSVSLTVTDVSWQLPKILQTIGRVESVEVHSPTLNDVFLYYTGREMRDSSPEGGWAERTMRLRSKR